MLEYALVVTQINIKASVSQYVLVNTHLISILQNAKRFKPSVTLSVDHICI